MCACMCLCIVMFVCTRVCRPGDILDVSSLYHLSYHAVMWRHCRCVKEVQVSGTISGLVAAKGPQNIAGLKRHTQKEGAFMSKDVPGKEKREKKDFRLSDEEFGIWHFFPAAISCSKGVRNIRM